MDYSLLSLNPNITWEIVKNNPDPPGGKWYYFYLSENPNITWEIARDNPEKKWSYVCLSSNSNITWEIARNNPEKEWDYSWLSQNKFLHHKYSVRYKKHIEEIVRLKLQNNLIDDLIKIVVKYLT